MPRGCPGRDRRVRALERREVVALELTARTQGSGEGLRHARQDPAPELLSGERPVPPRRSPRLWVREGPRVRAQPVAPDEAEIPAHEPAARAGHPSGRWSP